MEAERAIFYTTELPQFTGRQLAENNFNLRVLTLHALCVLLRSLLQCDDNEIIATIRKGQGSKIKLVLCNCKLQARKMLTCK